MTTEFSGFPPATLDFLAGIAANNEKAWFEAHRADYDAHWVGPAKAFVEAAGARLGDLAPVAAEPRVNGSIFRINRDIRFSADRRPYKDHLDFWFWEGERKTAVSGFFLRVSPNAVGIGVGAHGFDEDRLRAFRAAVVDPKSAAALGTAVAEVEGAGWAVRGERYKQVPRGFTADGETQERFLRHAALWCGEDEPHPRSLHSKRFVSYCMNRWEKLVPLHRWLVDTLA